MPYSTVPAFAAGQIDVSARFNTIRSNDRIRADGGELVDGDDHGHLIVEDGQIASMNSNTWYPVTFSLTFHKPPVLLLFLDDSDHPGAWTFQFVAPTGTRYFSQARNLGSNGGEVRAYMPSGTFDGVKGLWVAIGV